MHHDTRDIEISRKGLATTAAHLAGRFCNRCEDIDFDDDTDSATRFAESGNHLVLLARENVAQVLRKARKKLKLSQAEAALIAGSGHNAFSRNETGASQPVAGVVHLFTLLARHPELLEEVRGMSAKEMHVNL